MMWMTLMIVQVKRRCSRAIRNLQQPEYETQVPPSSLPFVSLPPLSPSLLTSFPPPSSRFDLGDLC
eukprot:766817-Hanusia_phi.AAC.3